MMDVHLVIMFAKTQARSHIDNILAWEPKAIIMAHGLIIDNDATAFLEKSFSWVNRER